METLKNIVKLILTALLALLTLRFLKGGSQQGQARKELEKAENEALAVRQEYDALEAEVQELKKQEFKGTDKGAEDYWNGVLKRED